MKAVGHVLAAAAFLASSVILAGNAADPERAGTKEAENVSSTHSASQLKRDPIGLSAAITTVRTGGSWADGGSSGSYRVVIVDQGFEHVVSKVYIQWIEIQPEERTQHVLVTALFEKINSRPMYSLDITSFDSGDGVLEVHLSGYNAYSNEAQNFTIRAREPGSAFLTVPE